VIKFLRGVILAISGAILASCTAANQERISEPHVLRIADWSEPSSLNPLLAHDQDTIGLDLLVVQTLVGISRDNKITPVLVTRVPSRANGDISSDGRTIVYHLRDNVRFADGVPLRSADVAFTYHAIMDPRNPVIEDAYRRIVSLTTPNPQTVVVKLREPWNAATRELFAESDFAFGILPAHAFKTTLLRGSAWEQTPFGTGPFRVTRWFRGDRIVFEPNAYFAPRPKLKRIDVRIMPDLSSVAVALRSGEVDVARVPSSLAAQIRPDSGLRIVATPINGMDYLSLQTSAAPTNDVRVRRAIVNAIDVKMIGRALHIFSPPAAAFLPPVLSWHDTSLEPAVRDVSKADLLLKSAGWEWSGSQRKKDGVPLNVLIVAQIGSSGVFSALVQQQLQAAGIGSTVKSFPASIFNAPNGPLRTGRFNVAEQGWIGGADPEQSVDFACSQVGANGTNIFRFCDPRFDAAYRDQASTADEVNRASDFRAMQQIIDDEAPIVPLYYTQYLDAENRHVVGLARNMLGYPLSPEMWDVK
jgi:peptide/nickel transport system substrate-binding protein